MKLNEAGYFMKIWLVNFVLFLTGRPFFQPIWEFIFRMALAGMNFGRGTTPSESGENLVLDFLFKVTRKKDSIVVFDVGANIGDYSFEVLKRFGARVNLFCFEPSPKAFSAINNRFGNQPNVQLVNIGFGEKEGNAILYSPEEGAGIASIYCRRLDHRGLKMDHTEKIRLRTLDNFCKEHNINNIDLLKLDVEGNEYNVLKGTCDLIKSNSIAMVQFEFTSCNIDSKTYLQDFYYFLSPYFNIYRILRYGFYKLPKYRETDEIFVDTNYLAILKTIDS
jgi:FkbM family methyltransferase